MFRLEIKTANAAFDAEALAMEIARQLRWTARCIEAGDQAGTLRDINGNTVGSFSLKGRQQ
jgi:hypothetical protein